MTTRMLPREEWAQLADTDLWPLLDTPDTSRVQVVVVERDGVIVGHWALTCFLHAHVAWIHPDDRRRGGVARRLVRGIRDVAAGFGFTGVMLAASDDAHRDFLSRLGASALPGQAFFLPLDQGQAS